MSVSSADSLIAVMALPISLTISKSALVESWPKVNVTPRQNMTHHLLASGCRSRENGGKYYRYSSDF